MSAVTLPPVAALADWALALRPAQVPPMVLRHARLQVVGVLGAAAALGVRSGGAAAAGALADAELDPGLVLSGGGAAAALVACAGVGPDHSLDDVLMAVIAANEISSRAGLAQALGPRGDALRAQTAGIAAIVARGRIEGVDAPDLAAGLGVALSRPGLGAGPGAAVQAAVADALAHPWRSATRGSLAPTGSLVSAWSGLGAAFWTHGITHRWHPGALPLLVPLQAMHEVLRRHVKAADKRLRADQIERVIVRGGHPGLRAGSGQGWTDGLRCLPALISALVHSHALDLDGLRGPLQAGGEGLAALAGRVELHHDPIRALSTPLSLVEAAPQLLGGLSPRARVDALGRLLRGGGAPPAPGWWRGLKRLPLDALLTAARNAGGDLGASRLDQLALRADTELVLMTTRGGSWPERRSLTQGGPASAWEPTVDGVLQLAAGGLARPVEVVRGALDAPGDQPASAWLSAQVGWL